MIHLSCLDHTTDQINSYGSCLIWVQCMLEDERADDNCHLC